MFVVMIVVIREMGIIRTLIVEVLAKRVATLATGLNPCLAQVKVDKDLNIIIDNTEPD
jgi:hypothetical protein